MAKYLIHACPKRIDYVNDYLVPSMLRQGIEKENILIYNDEKKLGNLRAFKASSELVCHEISGTWHLQDDVIISSKFREVTETYDKGVVCGFCNVFSKDLPIGIRLMRDMWYSFPCIRIPNNVLKQFVQWLNYPDTQTTYRYYIEANKFDDTLFRKFMTTKYPDKIVHNLCPNIVDNVDYLLGGSIINYTRDKEKNVNSIYYNEQKEKAEFEDAYRKSVYKHD